MSRIWETLTPSFTSSTTAEERGASNDVNSFSRAHSETGSVLTKLPADNFAVTIKEWREVSISFLRDHKREDAIGALYMALDCALKAATTHGISVLLQPLVADCLEEFIALNTGAGKRHEAVQKLTVHCLHHPSLISTLAQVLEQLKHPDIAVSIYKSFFQTLIAPQHRLEFDASLADMIAIVERKESFERQVAWI